MAESEFISASKLPLEPSAETDGAVQYLLLALGEREYGVRLGTLGQVLRFNPDAVTPVPNTPYWLEGIISIRGNIVSVVNLKQFLGLSSRNDESRSATSGNFSLEMFGIGAPIARLVVLQSEELQVGVVVDDIKGVIFVDPAEVKPETAGSGLNNSAYVEGLYDDPKTGKSHWLLDTYQLIASPEMLAFEPILM